jgi:hypothetical protein
MVDHPGVPTFMRKRRSNNNAFQISSAWNMDGQDLISKIRLEALAKELVVHRLQGTPLREFSGDCGYGKFASVVFSAESFSHCQVWFVSNGVHFISATFICDGPPTLEELNEAEGMALSLHFKSSSGKDSISKASAWWRRWSRDH